MQNISLLVLMLSPLGGSPSPQPVTPDILARKRLKKRLKFPFLAREGPKRPIK